MGYPAQRQGSRRVYALRALLTPQERHELTVLAARRQQSTQELVGHALRRVLEEEAQ